MGILKRNTTNTDEKEMETVSPKKPSTMSTAVLPAHKRILLGAHVSEKAASVEASGTYTFRVTTQATKGDIAKAIRTHYGVMPVAVRVMNIEGKRVRFGKSLGKRNDWKKAVVTLPEGKHIDIHSGI